jgi:hypothetical protein
MLRRFKVYRPIAGARSSRGGAPFSIQARINGTFVLSIQYLHFLFFLFLGYNYQILLQEA